jgi:hypothetical protein
MQAKYQITIEFTPDLTADPDAFRLHRKRTVEVAATKEVVDAVWAFERVLAKAAATAEGES